MSFLGEQWFTDSCVVMPPFKDRVERIHSLLQVSGKFPLAEGRQYHRYRWRRYDIDVKVKRETESGEAMRMVLAQVLQ